MIRLDGATFLLQWSVGGLGFLWVTTRRREVGTGYGWLLRGVFGTMALAALVLGLALDPVPVREVASAAVVLATGDRARPSPSARREAPDSFPLWLDAVAPAFGVVGLVAAGIDAGSPAWLSVLRTLVGAAFLGVDLGLDAARSLVPRAARPGPPPAAGARAARPASSCRSRWRSC